MAVAFDAVGPTSSGTASATSPLTWSHTNSGNGILVGVTTFTGSTNTVTAVTYGGVTVPLLAFVQGGTGGAGGFALYGLVGGTVPTGANTVSVSFSDGANHNAGSISVSGAGSLGTPASAGVSGASGTVNVTGTTAGGLIVAGSSYGGDQLNTFSGTNSVTVRWQHPGSPNSGADNGVGGTVASAGGTQTVGFTDTGSDFWGIVAVEVIAGGGGGGTAAPPLQARPGKTWRRRFRHRQLAPFPAAGPAAGIATPAGAGAVTAVVTQIATATAAGAGSVTATTAPPVITGLGGTGAGYFTDNYGHPRMWLGDEIWALLTNAGRWNSGNYQATFDAYFATRAAQGYTVCYSDMFGSTFIGGAANGQMWNGQTPFTSGNPSSGLNNTYWQVIDYALNSALANGITLALSFGGHWDWDTSGNAMFGFTGTQYQAAGNAIGTRYASQPNIAWLIMDDYFGSFDSSLSSLLTGLRASGDTHPIAIENYPETSSRFDLSTSGSLSWGASNTQYNFGYSYGETYLNVEYMYAESSPLTCIYGDGYFYQGSSTYNGGNSENSANAFDHAMRQDAWWAVASGARGWNIGDEALWQWASTAPAAVSTQWFAANNAGAIRTFMESLPGWHTLAPAAGSTLITAGRGTRATQPSSGGGGGQYEIAFTNAYVAASRTPDSGSGSSLAVLYFPAGAATVTIDQTKIASGYTATWVDPVTCATTSATTGTTYNPATPGTNSRGGTDWVLVLQGPAGGPSAGAASVAGAAAVTAVATQIAPATAAGAGAVTAVATVTAPAAAAGAGSVTDVVTQIAGAAAAGAGSVTATGAQSGAATATAAGAAAVTAVATQIAPATAAGAGTVTTAATTAAGATAAGVAAVTAVVTQIAPGTSAGAGAVTDVATQIAIASAAGAGSVTAAGASSGSATASAAGAGAVTAVATQIAKATGTGAAAGAAAGQITGTANVAGAASAAAKTAQAAPAAAAGAAALSALATQQAIAAITGTGSATAAGVLQAAFTVARSAATVTATDTSVSSVTDPRDGTAAVTATDTSASSVS